MQRWLNQASRPRPFSVMHACMLVSDSPILMQARAVDEDKSADIVDGKYSAVWQEGKGHWAVFRGGRFVTSAKKETKARQHVQELASGVHKSQRVGSASTASSRQKRPRDQAPSYAEPKKAAGAINKYGCKGKPEAEALKAKHASSPQKRKREAKEARMELGPESTWDEVMSCLLIENVY